MVSLSLLCEPRDVGFWGVELVLQAGVGVLFAQVTPTWKPPRMRTKLARVTPQVHAPVCSSRS